MNRDRTASRTGGPPGRRCPRAGRHVTAAAAAIPTSQPRRRTWRVAVVFAAVLTVLSLTATASSAQVEQYVPSVLPSERVTVSGAQVHESIAPQLRAMIAAAVSDSITLSPASGYRTTARQIQLRIGTCGSTPWEIFEDTSCNTVARPGRSMHQLGLAVDFVVGSRLMSSSDAAFTWMSNNAADYGFYNLPHEAWHWSINAR